MAFISQQTTTSSPHSHQTLNTKAVMSTVLLATLPGIAALTVFFGWGSAVNIVVTSVFALAFEALILAIRKRPIGFYLKDCSALVTAVLLGIALPPYAPYWLLLIGAFFAIIVAKQLYGGLGFNPFNPAMVAYVVLLISFPVEMTRWAAPLGSFDGHTASLSEAIKACFIGLENIDIITMATPLDTLKNNQTLLLNDLYQQPIFGQWAGLGWEWVNLGFLAGGIFLLYKRIYTWHAPLAMLISLSLCTLFFYDSGSSASKGSALFHLLSGASCFGAFFIVTDPVTSAASNKGKLIYGALIGLLVFIIRSWGNYPDAVAFAVLLMNFAAPFIDHYTKPRSYGHATKTYSKEPK